jgi:beta-galactosidase
MPFDRRTFLHTSSAYLASLAAAPFRAPEDISFADSGGRQVHSLNQRWLFSPHVNETMRARDYDDTAFEQVMLPHTNIRLPWHNFDQDSYQFVSIYRRHLKLPEDLTGKRIFVDFEGVMTKSTLWFNGARVGDYLGGYTPFSFELTHLIDHTGENGLAVEVDSRELPGIPPFGYEIDFLTFGGIYREAALRIVPAVYIENIHARASGVQNGAAALDATVYLDQTEASPGSAQLELALLDSGTLIASTSRALRSDAKKTEPVAYDLSLRRITGIASWDLDTPHLYTVRVRLIAAGVVVDEDARTVGFRKPSPFVLPVQYRNGFRWALARRRPARVVPCSRTFFPRGSDAARATSSTT